jgi:nicotinamidase-related amidase
VILNARPRPFPFAPERTALLVIDLQNDFLHPDGYCCSMPGVTSEMAAAARSIVPRVARVIEWARRSGVRVIYTRESHEPDLRDLTPSKKIRYENAGYPVGAPGRLGRFLVRGERGVALIDELSPQGDEWQVDKPGQSAFYATTLEARLREAGIDALLFTGVTTECCVLATYRQAADLGFFTLLLEDCCAAFDVREHQAAVTVLLAENGALGWVCRSEDLFQ